MKQCKLKHDPYIPKDPTNKRGCPKCERTRNAKQTILFRKRNPDKEKKIQRKYDLKRSYGITPDQYDELFIYQNGCCPGCSLPQSHFKIRFAVDHNHDNGEIRGLLCSRCNIILGMAKDSIKVLENLKEYLLKANNARDVIPIRGNNG